LTAHDASVTSSCSNGALSALFAVDDMEQQTGTRASSALQARHISSLLDLDEHQLVKVLLAAERAGTLARLASLSKQLCSLARSRVPVWLRIRNQQQAGLVVRSHTQGRPPFSGCTQLSVAAGDMDTCRLAQGVLAAAQQWPALEYLSLSIFQAGSGQHRQQQQVAEGPTVELWASNLLSSVAALQQLRSLDLEAPALGARSAQHIVRLTQLTSMQIVTKGAAAAAAELLEDLTALSAMTNLVELKLHCNLAPYLPGPYCFPSSLTELLLDNNGQAQPVAMALWVAHIPGCSALQSLRLDYGNLEQHPSTHPTVVVRALAQHCRQLRSLSVRGQPWGWSANVKGLSWVAVPEDEAWYPDASLAALTGLQTITSNILSMEEQEDWEHLAQLTSLTRLALASFYYAPPLHSGAVLAVLELDSTCNHLTGHQLGRMLLACPSLMTASLKVGIGEDDGSLSAGPPLPPHPTLTFCSMFECYRWGDAAAAVKQFAALAPVLGRVPSLALFHWPAPRSRRGVALPDLSPCTALIGLQFAWAGPHGNPPEPYQEDLLSMVAPLAQLQWLEVRNAPWVNARVALGLQSMLPQLQSLHLAECGKLSAAGQHQQQDEEEAEEEEQAVLLKVESLLRPGLQLRVTDW
jgi:hypothetical protein